jgi:periplasmic protein TonB
MKHLYLILIGLLLSANVAFAQKTDTNKVVITTATADDVVYTSVETLPEFPGGIQQFVGFLSSNIHYPVAARKKGIQGRVIITFIIEKDGSLSNIKVARGIGGGCDEEALRVMNLSPKWKPGMQNGQAVRVAYSVPISFTLTK